MEAAQAEKPRRRAGPATPKRPPDRSQVRAALRALDLLACLRPARPTVSLTEFARETGLPLTTVSRLLATLEAGRFVRRHADGRYGSGTQLIRIGLAALRSLSVYDVAEPHLRRLADGTGETANLGVLDQDGQVIYLRQIESRHAIRHASWLGRTLPAAGTAIGDALLGRVGPAGYVATRRTIEPDVTAIAAPIHGPGSVVVGALSVTGPSFRISDADVARYGALVRDAAGRASQEMGFKDRPTAGG